MQPVDKHLWSMPKKNTGRERERGNWKKEKIQDA